MSEAERLKNLLEFDAELVKLMEMAERMDFNKHIQRRLERLREFAIVPQIVSIRVESMLRPPTI